MPYIGRVALLAIFVPTGDHLGMAWTIAAHAPGGLLYGEGIKTPRPIAFPFRFLAAMQAAWWNRRAGGDVRYQTLKLPRDRIKPPAHPPEPGEWHAG